MDNVKKYQFWYCFGATLLLIPVGWWLGTGKLAAEAKQQISVIDGARNGLPSQVKNEKWKRGLEKVNTKRAETYRRHAKKLFENQFSYMVWPHGVAPAMKDAKFFGPGNDERARRTYKAVYDDDCTNRVYPLVDPVVVHEVPDPDDPTGMRKKYNVSGKVEYFPGQFYRVPRERWRFRDPTWQEMWEAQTDNWLMAALLQSIDRVNRARGAKSIHDASIRKIVTLYLRGGSRTNGEVTPATTEGGSEPTSTDAASEGFVTEGGTASGIPGLDTSGERGSMAGAGAGGIEGGAVRPGMSGPAAMEGGAGGEGGSAGQGGQIANLVLGTPVPRETTSEGEGEEQRPGATSEAVPSPDSARGFITGGEGGTGQDTAKFSPWVDNDPEMPFKTRGFVLKVLMKRRDVPLLIKELTNAQKTKFPVEILWLSSSDSNLDLEGLEELQRYRSGGVMASQGGFSGGGFAGNDAASPMGGFGGGRPGAGFPMNGVPPIGGGAGFSGGRPPFGGARPPFGGARPPFGGGSRPFGPGALTPGPGGMESDMSVGGDGQMGAAATAYRTALLDKDLSYVHIIGLMTIYQPPKEQTETADGKTAGKANVGGQNNVTPAKAGTPQKAPDKAAGTSPGTKTPGQPGVPVKNKPPAKAGTAPKTEPAQKPAPGPDSNVPPTPPKPQKKPAPAAKAATKTGTIVK